jgi:hypothetical protein
VTPITIKKMAKIMLFNDIFKLLASIKKQNNIKEIFVNLL